MPIPPADSSEAPLPTACRRRWTWVMFALLLAFQLIYQAGHGARESDLGGDPDEAAHAVTSLMLRDFYAGGWRQSPMAFAQAYYTAFPKVALGHYPPGYYLLAGLWLLMVPSIKGLFILQSGLAAGLGAQIYRYSSRVLPMSAACAAAVLSSILPLTLKQTQFVMSDLLVAILCLLAAAAWVAYLQRPGYKHALGFGLLAAAAILTKGSALALCLVPPVATLLSGRWRLILTPSWWLAAVPVGVLAGPWMLYSTRITAEGMIHQPWAEYVQESFIFYARALPQSLGWPLLILVVIGLARWSLLGLRHKGLPPGVAAALALLTGVACICLCIPAGYSTRYLMPALAPLLMAAVTAAQVLSCLSPRFRWQLMVVIVAAAFAFTAPWPQKNVQGFSQAVMRSDLPGAGSTLTRWLVASDPRGEGAIIASAAFCLVQRSPSPLQILRGSKELAKSDWMGRGYTTDFTDDAMLLKKLDELKVQRVFLDLSVPEALRTAHEKGLERALSAQPTQWQLDFEQPITRLLGETGVLRVYRRL